MYYYKVTDMKTGELICAATSLNFAKFNKKHLIFVLCDEEEGQYLKVQNCTFISRDMRVPYPPHREKYRWVDLHIISKTEWEKLKNIKINEKFK